MINPVGDSIIKEANMDYFKYPLEDIALFDMSDFLTYENHENRDYYMDIFYYICDNAQQLYEALQKKGKNFNFSIDIYKSSCKYLNDHAHFEDFVDDHWEDLKELVALTYRFIWRESNSNGSVQVKYPYNLFNDVIFGSMIPESIDAFEYDYDFYYAGVPTKNDRMKGLDYALGQLDAKELAVCNAHYRDNIKLADIADKLAFKENNFTYNLETRQVYSLIKNIRRKLRKYYRYYTKGYDYIVRREQEDEKSLESYYHNLYENNQAFLDMLDTPVIGSKLECEPCNDKIVKKLVTKGHIDTLKQLYLSSIEDIQKLLGKPAAAKLNTACRRYYRFTIIPAEDISKHKRKIEDAKKAVERYKS